MTTAHISTLHFAGRQEMAKKRLQRLRSAKFVRTRQRNLFKTGMHLLGARGIDVLRERGILREYPSLGRASLERRTTVSDSTLRHELDVMDVKASMHRAALSAKHALVEFTTWPLLNQFVSADRRGRKVPVRPDGFLRIVDQASGSGTQEHSFFLELDRSTEAQIKLISRAALYVDHYRSGGFARQNGGAGADYRKYPFRVLYVLKNAERRNNTTERLLQCEPPILAHIWLTTFEEATRDPFGPIWIRPVDYRDSLSGSRFDLARRVSQPGYKRQTQRDAFVEESVPKIRLITEQPAAADEKKRPGRAACASENEA